MSARLCAREVVAAAARCCIRQGDSASHDRQPRRKVELKGFGVLEDGTTLAISVLDLSYDGCKVQTASALVPGILLKISILGARGSVPAVVRWCKEGQAGLRFSQEDAPKKSHAPREIERSKLDIEASLRRPGRKQYQVHVSNLAPTGCKVEFVERPRPDERLWIKFDGLDALEARVSWVDGFHGGLEFVRPIYPAVFDLLLARLGSPSC
jgi:hypothetical protein